MELTFQISGLITAFHDYIRSCTRSSLLFRMMYQDLSLFMTTRNTRSRAGVVPADAGQLDAMDGSTNPTSSSGDCTTSLTVGEQQVNVVPLNCK